MIAITGGGTGGHLVIAKAIKEELNQRGIKPIYIGSTSGQDKMWFEDDDGFEKSYFLESKGVVNKKGLGKLFSLINTIKLAFTARQICKRHDIKAIFSVGGYSAAPTAFAALLSRIPLFIHEQNAIEGKLNHLLKPFSTAFFSSYHTTATQTNYPVSNIYFQIRRQRKQIKTIIFLGGSQGAAFINQLACQLAPLLNERGINIIHQTGKKEFEAMRSFYQDHNITADVFDFNKTLYTKLEQADFAISRSGASTLWELSAAAIPALYIPFPHAAANHQYHNAQTLLNSNAGLLLQQSDTFTPETVIKMILDADIEAMSNKLMSMIEEGGAREIVDLMLKQSSH